MKGTIIDFLNLATEDPELAKEIADLAARFDFEFTSDELSDEQLESIAGGLTIGGGPSVTGITADQVGYLTITLKNAMVSSYDYSGDSGDTAPTETTHMSDPDD